MRHRPHVPRGCRNGADAVDDVGAQDGIRRVALLQFVEHGQVVGRPFDVRLGLHHAKRAAQALDVNVVREIVMPPTARERGRHHAALVVERRDAHAAIAASLQGDRVGQNRLAGTARPENERVRKIAARPDVQVQPERDCACGVGIQKRGRIRRVERAWCVFLAGPYP